MKTLVMTTATSSLVLLFALFTISFPLLTQSRVLPSTDANDVIVKTCKQTPFSNLCISVLREDPRSSGADVRGLALIMVGVLEAKSKETLSHIKDLAKTGPKQPLSFCADNYKAIITADVPEATEALNTGDYKFAEQGTNDAANDADACEKRFSGSSPLTKMNIFVHDVAAVAAAMARILLTS